MSRLELFPTLKNSLFSTALEALSALLLLIALFLLYRFVPRCPMDGQAALVGAILAALLILAARPYF